MIRTRALFFGALTVSAALLILGSFFLLKDTKVGRWVRGRTLTKHKIAQVLADSAAFYRFPTEMDLPDGKKKLRVILQYTFDQRLQDVMETLFRNYRPDYGAFVAMDPDSGRVLSMVSYIHARDSDPSEENLALRSTFPSASVFKVVTAAAAIEDKRYSSETVIPVNGRYHTLYRSNVLRDRVNRWTRYITLRDAFAKSINSVFGKIGAFAVGPEELGKYATRFGFNRLIEADFPVQEGHAPIPQDKWGLAETASGFTRDNTMSPLQGALIAATIANHGIMMEPFMVDTVHTIDGTPIYTAEPAVSTVVIDPQTAEELRAMMRETVRKGTSRGSFRGFFRKRGEFADLDVGGKTGSLTGKDPKGRYDWFVGYADDGFTRVAVSALTIHERLWRVKSSYLARRAIETYFSERHRSLAGD